MTLNFCCEHRYASGFDLKIQFETGEGCTALLGPSGSGKTTVLSIISGTLTPRSGNVSIGERVVVDTEQNLILKPEQRMVGCVFQDALLFPHLNVRQNLEFGTRVRKTSNQAINFNSIVEVLELGELLDRMPHELSGGQQQRVALGRAIASGPELLLLDEPLSSLDRPLGKRVLTFLKTALAEWEIPAIYVTHSETEAEFISDKTINLDDGRVAGS